MAETEGSDDTSENELLDKSLSVWKGGVPKERFEPIPLDLHTASSLGQYEAVKVYILRKDTDIDKRNRGGWTSLMYACYIGHDNIVNLLLEAGVNVNIRNHKGETPLMLASSCGNESVGYFLLHQEAEIEAKDERGWTALFHATYSGHQNMVRFLLEHGANMNAVERSMGMTPFMEAAAEGHEIIVQLFLQNGVDVNTRAYNGDTARSLALMHGNMKIVSLIDNHVMPITSLRAEAGLETDLASSDNTLLRNRRGPLGGGPSIMDGPSAIARLIDRTKDTPTPIQPKQSGQGLVPKGYVTFPDNEPDNNKVKGLSNREVTSPINPEDCSGSRDSFDIEDDTNAFSKTGALTIKSSSGSSGGLVGIFGIRGREESLDSEDFPHESSCEDSNRQGYSGESSSDEGIEEPNDETKQISDELKVKCEIGETGEAVANEIADTVEVNGKLTEAREKRKPKNKKLKDNLTTEKVSELEVMKNSVSEWVDNVNHAQPIPQTNLYTLDSQLTQPYTESIDNTGKEAENGTLDQSAIKLEYQNKPIVVNSEPKHYTFPPTDPVTPTPPLVTHLTTSELFDQVAENVKQLENKNVKDFQPETDSKVVSEDTGRGSIPPVSALNLLNTTPNAGPNTGSSRNPHYEGQGHPDLIANDQNYHKNQTYNGVEHPPLSLPQGNSGHQGQVLPQGHSSQQGQIISQGHNIPQGQTGPPAHTMPQGHLANFPPPSHHPKQEPLATQSRPPQSHINQPFKPPPGFSPQFNPYQMFPQVTTATLTPGYPSAMTSATRSDTDATTTEPTTQSSNMVFLERMKDSQPTDLQSLLDQLGLQKHLPTFQEQDVDLQVFLSLSDNDLKEIGIKLFGPRKKMTNAIARWHSKAKIAVGEVEQAYADRLAGELQEMNGQLQAACEQLETLKAQIAQEQQLRNVTETCLMEERAAWSHVQRIIMDTRQQCEDFKDALKKLNIYSGELKSRVPPDSALPTSKRPIRGAGAMRDEHSQDRGGIVTYDKLPTETVVRKVDAYLQETNHLLGTITLNTDRLLGRNTQLQSMESGFS